MFQSHSRLRQILSFTLICVVFCLFAANALAAPGINRQINYQGRLLDSTGEPVLDGAYDLTLSLYDAATVGNRLWTAAGTLVTPTPISVNVQNGLFSIQLGDTNAGLNAFAFDFNQDSLYLGVTVEADAEMTPRKRLTSVPYAFESEALQGQHASSSVSSAGGVLFNLQQHSADAAVGSRTALYISTSGTSNALDYLLKASNGAEVFTVSRQGNVTTTGNLAVGGNVVLGDASGDVITTNARFGSDIVPSQDGVYGLGSLGLRWLNVFAQNVSSTNVTSTNLFSNFASINGLQVNGTRAVGSFGGAGAAAVLNVPSASTWNLMLSNSLGSTTYGFQVFQDESFSLYSVGTSTREAMTIIPASTDNADLLGSSGIYFGTFGTSTIPFRTVAPVVNDQIDLGNPIRAWRNIYASGTVFVTTDVIVAGQSVCLENGTNCPSGLGEADTLLSVTNRGASATATLMLFGGAIGSSFTATSTGISLSATGTAILRTTQTESLFISGSSSFGNFGGYPTALQLNSPHGGVWNTVLTNSLATTSYGIFVDPDGQFHFRQTQGDLALLRYTPTSVTALTPQADRPGFYIGSTSSPGQTEVFAPAVNNTVDLGSSDLGFSNIYASGTAYVGTDVVVNGQSVCLENGVNCPVSSGSPAVFAYDLTTDTIYPVTSTSDVLIGGATSTFAPFHFLTQSTSSRLMIGANGSSTNVVIGGATSTITNSDFQLDGNDLYVAGNIGSASSVYTNGAFIAGNGTTIFADGAITKTNGSLSVSSTANIILNPDGNILIGTSTGSEKLTVAGNISNLISSSSLEQVARKAFNSSANPLGVAIQGEYAYVANFNGSNIATLDISNPAAVVQVATTTVAGGPYAVVVQGRYLYTIANSSDGLRILDISNPSIPVLVGTLPFLAGADPIMLAVQGKYVYVANSGINSLATIDISNAAAPVQVATTTFNAGSFPVSVVAHGRFAFVSLNGGNAFATLDLSNPALPLQVATTTVTAPAYMAVQGRYLYVTDGTNDDLLVFDIANATGSVLVATVPYTSGYNPQVLSIHGDYLYMPSFANGWLATFDISNPLATRQIATTTISGGLLTAVAVAGRYAYVTDVGVDGLVTLEIPGLDTSALSVDTAQIGELSVYGNGSIANQLIVGNSLQIGAGGFYSAGAFAIGATNTTSTISGQLSVNGQAVCLANGVNCPASSGSSPFSYNSTFDTIAPVTSSADVLIGGTTSTSAAFRFLTQSTSSRFLIGANGSSTDVVIGGSTSTITNSGFQLDGNDLYVAGNIGSASSVYTNGAFIAGNGTTIFSDGFIAKTNGSLSVSSSVDLLLNPNGSVGIGTNAPTEKLTVVGSIRNAIAPTSVFRLVSTSTPQFNLGQVQPVQGKYAYGSDMSTGEFVTLDVSDPEAPQELYRLAVDDPGGPNVWQIDGRYAYVASLATPAIFIIDISNPKLPSVVSTMADPDIQNLTVVGKTMYVSMQTGDIVTYDISNPIQPRQLDSILVAGAGSSRLLRYHNGYLFFIDENEFEFQAVRVDNPADMQLANAVSVPGIYAFDLKGRYAYVQNSENGENLAVFDVTDPNGFVFVSSSSNSGLNNINVEGNYLFASDFNGDLLIFDLTHPTAPELVQTIAGAGAGSFAASGRNLYASYYGDDLALAIFQIPGLETSSLSASLAEVGELAVHGDAEVDRSLSVGKSLTVGFGGINSVGGITSEGNIQNTLRDVTGFREVGSVNIAPGSNGFYPAVVGDYAYYPDDGLDSFSVVDVSDVASPRVVGSVNLNSGADPFEVVAAGQYVFMSSASALMTIDVSDPTDPIVVATTTLFVGTRPYGMIINGKYMYLQAEADGFYVLDISNPLAPTTTYRGSELYGTYLQYKDGFVYLGDGSAETLYVLDVRNPSAVTVAATMPFFDGMENIMAQHDHYLYIMNAGASNGIKVIDIADPFNPVHVATTTEGFAMSTMFINGQYMYIPDGGGSILVFDLASSTNAVHVGSILANAGGLVFGGKYMYVAGYGPSAEDLGIIEIPGIHTTALLSSSAEFDLLIVMMDATIANQLRVGGSLMIGSGGFTSNGAFAISSTNTTSTIAGPLTVQGQSVCLANGTNCPVAGGTDTLLSVTNRGSIATSTLTLYGGATGTAFTATSTGIAFDGRNGTNIFGNVSATRDLTVTGNVAIGQGTTTSPFTVNCRNQTNIQCATFNNIGPGTGGLILNFAAGGSTSWGDTVGSVVTNEYINRSVQFRVQNQAFDPTSSFDYKFAAFANPQKNLMEWTGSDGQTADMLRIFRETASSSPIFRVAADGGVYSSGTGIFTTDVLVNGQSVCLEDGTNCQAGGGSSPFSYNSTFDTIAPVTSSADVLIGGATSTSAAFRFLTQATSSRFLLGANGSSTDVVLGGSTSTITNTLFQLNGNDLYAAGNIGSASSVYTNGAFVAGNTYFGDGFVNKTDGDLILTASSGILRPSVNGTLSLGSNTFSFADAYFTGTVSSSYLTFTAATGSRLSLNSFAYARAIATTTLAITGAIDDVVVAGKYAYLKSSGSAGFFIYDITNPAAPSSVGAVSDTSIHLAVAGKYLYSAVGIDGLAIYDVSNPSAATLVATEDTGGVAQGVAISGKNAYIADGVGGLVVMDVSDPTDPAVLGVADGFGNANGVYVQGRYAYVVDTTSNTFKIVDVASSTQPTTTASLTTNDPLDVFVSGRYAYVADGAGAGLVIIDIGDPTAPAVVGTADTAGAAIGVVVAGNYAYVADGAVAASKIAIVDVTNVNTPTVVKTLLQGNSCSEVALSGPYLYGACTENSDLMVYDLGGINSPTGKIGSLETDVFAVNDSATFGNQVDIGGGLTVGPGGINSKGPLAAQGISSLIDNNASGTAGLFYRSFNGGTEVDAAIGITGFVTGTTGSIDDLPTFVELNNTLNFTGGNIVSAAGYFVNGVEDASGQSPALLAIDMTSSTIGGAIYGSRNCGGSTLANVMRLATDSNATIFRVNCDGQIFADNGTVGTPGDYAEYFHTNDTSLAGGEVVALETVTASSVRRAMGTDREYTLGVISLQPLVLGNAGEDGNRVDDPNYKVVGLLGQIPTRVSDMNGQITAGDKIMVGDNGVAVKATGVGMVIGMALENLTTASGTIAVYVDPTWSADGIFEAAASGTTAVTALGTATVATTTHDSHGLSFEGSAWSVTSSNVMTSAFTLVNDVISASSSIFRINNTIGAAMLTISDLGDVSVTGDLTVGRRLFLGSKNGGAGSTSTYIYVDDTQAPSSTYIATNADGWSTSSTYDYAERFPSVEMLVPGDIVTTDPTDTNHVKRATAVTDLILGIVSTKPGFITGSAATGTYPIALAGRVPTRISTENGPIVAGDQLAPSNTPGVAVKAVGSGPTVGVALESYDAPTEGVISVFVQPGWKGGEMVSDGPESTSIVYQAPVYDPGVSPRAGLARISAGSTSVNVRFPTLNAYPLTTVTPYGLPTAEWGLMNVNDHGFTIVLSRPETFDLVFSWKAEPSQTDGMMSFSDGTSAGYDPLTGQPLPTAATSTNPQSPTSVTSTPPTSTPPDPPTTP